MLYTNNSQNIIHSSLPIKNQRAITAHVTHQQPHELSQNTCQRTSKRHYPLFWWEDHFYNTAMFHMHCRRRAPALTNKKCLETIKSESRVHNNKHTELAEPLIEHWKHPVVMCFMRSLKYILMPRMWVHQVYMYITDCYSGQNNLQYFWWNTTIGCDCHLPPIAVPVLRLYFACTLTFTAILF